MSMLPRDTHRRLEQDAEERCPFCGIRDDDHCTSVPTGPCERALSAINGNRTITRKVGSRTLVWPTLERASDKPDAFIQSMIGFWNSIAEQRNRPYHVALRGALEQQMRRPTPEQRRVDVLEPLREVFCLDCGAQRFYVGAPCHECAPHDPPSTDPVHWPYPTSPDTTG